jgi:hypothetical protein
MYNTTWIKQLRAALNNGITSYPPSPSPSPSPPFPSPPCALKCYKNKIASLENVQIIAADDCCGSGWGIADGILENIYYRFILHGYFRYFYS